MADLSRQMDKKELLAKIAELRDAAERARAISVDLTDPGAEQDFVELARKLDAQAAALEQKATGLPEKPDKDKKAR